MDKLANIDWSLVQAFLAVADHGSLSAASQALGQSQPTLGRHIKTLETRLDVSLFQRHARGLALTEIGHQIRPAANAMRKAMTDIANASETQVGRLAGTVRIACSVFAAHYVLPPVVAQIRIAAPQISLVIQPSDDSDNLMYREADIAVRMYRPTQLDLITRHLADIEISAFAAQTYLHRKGRPKTLEALVAHDVVGFDASTLMIDLMRDMGHEISAEDFMVRTDNQTAYWEYVRAGCGIGFTQAHVGRADPLVEEIDVGLSIPPLPVWLTTHEQVRRIPRVDRVWDMLADGIPGAVRA